MSQMSEPFLYNYNTSTTSLLHWAYCYFVDEVMVTAHNVLRIHGSCYILFML